MRYRKKSQIVEAKLLSPVTLNEIVSWIGNRFVACDAKDVELVFEDNGNRIIARNGDFIVKSDRRRCFALSAPLFDAMYELLEDCV